MARKIALVMTLLLAAAPLAAYTIYLKDGSRLIAREKYTLEGDRALILLQNGTQTFLDANEIDVPRTEAANRNNYGTAMVLKDGELTEAAVEPEPRQERLGDLIGRRELGPQAQTRPQARRPTPKRQMAGDVQDLFAAQRQAFRNLGLAEEIQGVFMAQGVAGLQLAQGTAADRILLEITTDSEASVFRALKVSADALLHVRTRTAAPISAFEIVLVTSSNARAGQFFLDPGLASEVAEGRLDLPTFFVENVQF
jgi:hypothetical protein